MKQSKLVQVVALAIMGLSGHAMASPAVSPVTSSAQATVEFASALITSHSLNAVTGLKPGKATSNILLASGTVVSTSSSKVAVHPVRISGDNYSKTDYARFKVKGNNTGATFQVYFGAVNSRIAELGVQDWYDAGSGPNAAYEVRLNGALSPTIVADVYPITVNAAIYTP